MRQLLIGLAALAVLAPAVWVLTRASEPAAGGAPRERSFVFDASPETVVLRVRRSPRGPTYELRGDGALITNRPGGRSAQYSSAELYALLERLAAAGVFDLDQEEIRAALREKPRAFVGSVAYDATLEIHLTEYRGPDQDGGPLDLQLIVVQPDQLAAHLPEREDLRALHELFQELRRLTRGSKE